MFIFPSGLKVFLKDVQRSGLTHFHKILSTHVPKHHVRIKKYVPHLFTTLRSPHNSINWV